MDFQTKAGQLFCPIATAEDLEAVDRTLELLKPGGLMYRAFPGATIQKNHRDLPIHLAGAILDTIR